MQQTNNHQFNLIESADTFSPDPLNENMEKVEAAFAAVNTAMGSGGHTGRIAYGTYLGDGKGAKTLTFDFYPVVVFLTAKGSVGHDTLVLIRECAGTVGGAGGPISRVSWSGNSITYGSSNSDDYNQVDETVWFVAIGA